MFILEGSYRNIIDNLGCAIKELDDVLVNALF